MGEVYRVDDLKLGQAVALKFLPETLQNDPDRHERFLGEVRVARQITHPNVCRVHDIGEVDGQPFLSMEYVDGENLASLLRRIGRLGSDKALEIARQLCAGLAAAHAKGVLHRDLKPENIMIDGRGHARITDFGLAGLAGAFNEDEVLSGTPAYMSPEQLAGRAVTFKSDIYALGLVLYELVTGRRAFDGRSVVEVLRKREGTPTPPSDLVSDLDPGVERVILRCLARDPDDRPPSALAVAAGLPGSDPLAAALAAGETPSPELVASAGERGALRPVVGVACLVAILLGTSFVVATGRWVSLPHALPLEKTPEALEDRAREILRASGYDAKAADTADGFEYDDDYLAYLTEHDASRWDHLSSGRPPAVHFWYRQSPRPMVSSHPLGDVSPSDPPALLSGMASVELDPAGRLLSLYVVTPEVETPAASPRAPEWSALLSFAQLDPERLQETPPVWTPPFYCETRKAWAGTFPDRADLPLRVEAASYQGRPVSFRIIGPWTRPERMRDFRPGGRARAADMTGCSLFLLAIAAAAILARRNLRIGRGDRRGALRLAAYSFAAGIAIWILVAHHVATLEGESSLALQGFGLVLVASSLVWLLYVALEPFFRRLWPKRIVSWSRLLAGRVRDPLVGRDILIGVLAGVLVGVAAQSLRLLTRWLMVDAPLPRQAVLSPLLGLRYVVGDLLGSQVACVGYGLMLILLLFLLRGILRSEWLAAGGLAILAGLQGLGLSGGTTIASALVLWAAAMMLAACVIVILLRFGLLAFFVGIAAERLLVAVPIMLDVPWFRGISSFYLLLLLALALYGLETSRAGEPFFGGDFLKD
jgi:hypothetical protein